jgi:hypothetical protein
MSSKKNVMRSLRDEKERYFSLTVAAELILESVALLSEKTKHCSCQHFSYACHEHFRWKLTLDSVIHVIEKFLWKFTLEPVTRVKTLSVEIYSRVSYTCHCALPVETYPRVSYTCH